MTTHSTSNPNPSARCARVQPMLEAFADGELARVQAGSVDEHLRECAACTAELASLRTLHDTLHTSIERELSADPTADMWDSVRTAIAVEDAAEKTPVAVPVPQRLSSRPVIAFLGVIAVALVTIFAPPTEQNPGINVAQDTFVIEEIDAGNNNVMVFEAPDTKMTVIWVIDGEETT